MTIWNVYRLVDPRDEKPFYIGCTMTPYGRYLGHMTDPASSAWPRMRDIKDAGLRADMGIVAEFDNKWVARSHERQLIIETDGLLNRERRQPFVLGITELYAGHAEREQK